VRSFAKKGKADFIDSPSLSSEGNVSLSCLTADDDRRALIILCRIAHIDWSKSRVEQDLAALLDNQTRSEQFRPAIAKGLSDHGV
jgi:hypothetical protein